MDCVTELRKTVDNNRQRINDLEDQHHELIVEYVDLKEDVDIEAGSLARLIMKMDMLETHIKTMGRQLDKHESFIEAILQQNGRVADILVKIGQRLEALEEGK
jgi:chromosome segregation ATPase